MEKNLKRVKVFAVTLTIILLAIIAFCGLYVKKNNVWENLIPDFNYGMELNGIRELRFVLDSSEEEKNVYIDSEGNILGEVKEEETDGISLEDNTETTEEANQEPIADSEENKPNYATEVRTIKANEDKVKTIQNFEKTKKIIQKRLERETSYEYNIRLDTVTGEMVVEVPDDDNVSAVTSSIITKGDFKIIDEQTGIILIDKNDIKNIETGVYQSSGYQVCLQIVFNKEGAEKLKKISNEYRQVVNEAGESSITYVTVTLDGQTLLTTYFGEELSNGILQIPLGNPVTDMNELQKISDEAERLASILNDEELPIAYTLESDTLMKSVITNKNIEIAKIVLLVAFIIASAIFAIKFKSKGLLASILVLGYVSLLTLILKYTGVIITFNSVIAYLAMIILQYVFIKKMLKEQTTNLKETFWNVMKKYYITIVPVCIIAIIFTFVSSTVISSIGMVFFWGLVLQALYNILTIFALKLF